MREILFRGKRKDNGEWVEGYYTELPIGSLGATIFANDDEVVCEDTASYIIKVFTKQHSNYSNGNPLCVVECEKYEVDPSTVGQYTGLTDKNGKKIFEGDIVKYKMTCHFSDDDLEEFGNEYTNFTDTYVEVVKYYEKGCCFVPAPKRNDCEDYYYSTGTYGFEVIGNIHDNPELLKGSDDK